MRTIRRGVFETNSSSVHSLTIMTQKEYGKWNDENYIKDEEIYTFEEAKKELLENYTEEEIKELTDDDWKNILIDNDFNTKDSFKYDYETFEEFFTTPSGDKMVAFGYYGEDR